MVDSAAPQSRHSVAARGNSAGRVGFTLVEMLCVVLIIAILMGTLSVAISSARVSAKRTRTRENARQLAIAWSVYLNDQGQFPDQGDFDGEISGLDDAFYATPHNIGALLNCQYVKDKTGKKIPLPADSCVIYYETSEAEVERTGTYPSFSYTGTGILDGWKDPDSGEKTVMRFALDLDLDGRITSPVTGELLNCPTLAYSFGGYRDDPKYAQKFIVAY